MRGHTHGQTSSAIFVAWFLIVYSLLPFLLLLLFVLMLLWYVLAILCWAHTNVFRFSLSMRLHGVCVCARAFIQMHLAYTGWLHSIYDEDTRKSKKNRATTITIEMRQQRWRRLQRRRRRRRCRWRMKSERRHIHIHITLSLARSDHDQAITSLFFGFVA